MKMKIGDSVKLKDGRKFKVVSKDNGYFVLKDSKGKMAKVKDSTYSPEEMLHYLAVIGDDFSVPFAEVVENVVKMLKNAKDPKELIDVEEFLAMNGPKEEMNEAILAFIKENPDFDWSSVQI